MKIYDFDEKFYDYMRGWMAVHAGMTEKQIEDSYNQIMLNWLNTPAKWLDGEKPGEYFLRYSDPKDFMKLMEEYDKRDIGLPEPLYSRVVSLGESCVPMLMKIAGNTDRPESLRATAMAMLGDIGTDDAFPMYIDMVYSAADPEDEIANLAADELAVRGEQYVPALLERYDGATEYGQLLILDVCTNYPGDERVYNHLIDKLRNRPEQRALYASYLGKLGDQRAVDELMPFLSLTDLGYLDYIELRSAVEALGGDPGPERDFYGDPDFEAMRGM